MKMKHAELIAYAAQHPDGWASVEWCGCGEWHQGLQSTNPVTHDYFGWRIKPATIRINVEIPKPVPLSPISFDIYLKGKTEGRICFRSAEDRDEAERILIAALRAGND